MDDSTQAAGTAAAVTPAPTDIRPILAGKVLLANCQIRRHLLDFGRWHDCAMRDLVILFLHLLATIARLAGPGGARSVVAESVLVKHQLLILNRSRKRSPNLHFTDRMVAGLCPAEAADPFRDYPQTLNTLTPASSADGAEISPALLDESPDEAGTERTQPVQPRQGQRWEPRLRDPLLPSSRLQTPTRPLGWPGGRLSVVMRPH
jgi:hypothetical protein